RQVAGTNITVLVEGESGVGKELFAKAIHQLSQRRHKQMLIVNCGAIPEGLIESELFGNEKGAYTGAVEKRSGYFEEADKSTIFLDEIGEMPLTAQVRLLRVLETGEFSRVGSSTVLKADVRVIAATNKDLAKEVERGRFREDLYYRLSTVILGIPPLRERREDILPLFEHFEHRFAQKYDSSSPNLDRSARELLMRYRWPGNIRELRNVAEQAVVLMRGESIGAEELRPYLRGVTAAGSGVGLVRVRGRDDDESGADNYRERELLYRALIELRGEVRDMKEQVGLLARLMRDMASDRDTDTSQYRGRLLVMGENPPTRTNDDDSFIEDIPYELESAILDEDESERARGGGDGGETHAARSTDNGEPDIPTLEDAEKSLITTALKRFDGNRRQTAEALGISERTLYRKLKEMEAEEDD
ncbi:MAG: sigma-54-dependent Fis family transcriptional regulator, partial [Rhodothermales bacterium]|nr:sigma-54-dependent Fis family transcriptional regulator [Rhodothermales bacterium]